VAPYEYQWDFGDGSSSTWSTDPRASHSYTARGSLKAVLTARDSRGVQSAAPYFLHVFIPLPVTASAIPASGRAPVEVRFTAAGGGGSPPYTAYYWDFGDGGFSTAQNPTHVYAAARTYVARVSLRDSAGGAGSASITITVTPALGL
jgi:PKD repeat protein